MFNLVKENVAGIYVKSSSANKEGLLFGAKSLCDDIQMITGVSPKLDEEIMQDNQILIGTIGTDSVVDELVAEGILDVTPVQDKRESYMVQEIEYKGAKKLVVAGTETVSTLHGIYHISKAIGVSPWVYWADAMPAKRTELTLDATNFISKEPSVRYRGFFMNDEWPSLGNFVMNTFGDFNEFFYERVFQLLLRLRGNYFWPAMWSASLPLDGSEDPQANLKLATSLGITIGQSHHEPLTRASEEWDKVKSTENNVGYGADWNYYTNNEGLYRYWEDGMKRDREFSHMITIGMRGERDTMMLGENSTIQENVELLRRIITDQKKIIKDTDCDHMPKMLALYKEVEGFYYGGNGVKGLRDWDGLDDTILLLSDDNFANVRTLPTDDLRNREAGWGLYYHFDYHGAPISYEWVNSTPLPKVWEQMSMAYDYGIRDLWIVNVGDIRPDELPLSYFMDLAYDFEAYGTNHPNETEDYLAKWVDEQFGAVELSKEDKIQIAGILCEYARIHGLRRPEAMNPKVYHVTHFNETKKMIARCESLKEKTEAIYEKLPEEIKDTFYGLVYYPAVAGMNLQLMSLYAALNEWYVKEGVSAANTYDAKVKEGIELDEKYTKYYNEEMCDGKWKGMMSSKHACFVAWNEEGWHFPETQTVEVPQVAQMLVHAENADHFATVGEIILPEFTSLGKEKYTIEIANGGAEAFDFAVKASDGITTNLSQGTVEKDIVVIEVTASQSGTIEVTGAGTTVNVQVNYTDAGELPAGTAIERDGIVAMEAEHFVRNEAYDGYQYEKLENYGKTMSCMKIYPTIGNFDEIGKAPSLTYSVSVKEAGTYQLKVITSPNNNLEDGRTMRYAAVVNQGEIQIGDTIPATQEEYSIGNGAEIGEKCWGIGVLNNCHFGITQHELQAGVNEITIYGVEAGLALQKLVLYKGDLPESYLGPDESPIA